MNNDWAAKIWNAILIGCVIALVIAVIILAVAGVESACGSPGDIECPRESYPEPSPEPYPAPLPGPTAISTSWDKVWLPSVFKSK